MIPFLWSVGVLVIAIGVLLGFGTGDALLGVVSVGGGAVLLGISKMIEHIRDINHRLLGIPLTNSQIKTIIHSSKSYDVESKVLSLYPENESSYSLVLLEGESYINVDVFTNYVAIVEHRYSFTFPDDKQIQLYLSDDYYTGTELFKINNRTFVKISSLGLVPIINKDKVIIK